jgi:hypothetical protein
VRGLLMAGFFVYWWSRGANPRKGMAMNYHIVLGTAGWGVWHSADAGKSWVRHRKPLPLRDVSALIR